MNPADLGGQAGLLQQLGEGRATEPLGPFVMREEFIASLDPYLRPIPTCFAAKDAAIDWAVGAGAAARQAMQEPARAVGVAFNDAAAAKLAMTCVACVSSRPMAPQPPCWAVTWWSQCSYRWCAGACGNGCAPATVPSTWMDVQAVGDVDTARAAIMPTPWPRWPAR